MSAPAEQAEPIAREFANATARRSDLVLAWDKAPPTARALMVAAVAELLERGVISAGPATGVLPAITAPEAAERAATVLRSAEAHASGHPAGATALATVAAEWRNLSAALATTRGMTRTTDDE